MNLTIVIPVYNRASYIERTVQSVLYSTMQPTEIILVDNGSNDSSYEICKQLAERNNNITVLQELTPGAAAARNCGLSACCTEWVYFFDSDDEFDVNFIATISSLNFSNYDIIATKTNVIVHGKNIVHTFAPSAYPSSQILSLTLNTTAMTFRTDFIRKIGGWNNNCRIWDDWELGIRALFHYPAVLWYKEKSFHAAYIHSDSLTGDTFSQNYKQIIICLEEIYKEIKQYSKEKEKDLKALYLRSCIVLGQMKKELSQINSLPKEAAKELSAFIKSNFQPSFLGKFLEFYTQYGGRGAWRIASLFL